MSQIPLTYVKDVAEALSDCAAFFRKPQPTERSAAFWVRVVWPLPQSAVRGAFEEFMRSSDFMPTPEKIKLVAQDLHARATRERADRARVAEMPPAPTLSAAQLERFRAFLAEFNRPRQRPQGERTWAHRLRALEAAGAPLLRVQRENWRAAFGLPPGYVLPPAESDAAREAVEERLAIMAEGA